ncbi:MAG: BolA/IbaG family iron-sulfur metabolism protein [Cellvibrionaceae bacterium]|nr:BolA/IbaG family iron-sulfur metabolism protein [Cellvibrionaceae bacterium]
MEPSDIKAIIESAITDSQATVQSDGRHVDVVVVSPAFAGLSLLKKQQLVNAALKSAIADGRIHAVQMKTYTPEEWSELQG